MVLNKIIKLLSEIVGIDEEDITEGTEFTVEFGIEPIDFAKLIIEAEKEFNITIHDEYAANFKKVGDIVSHIEEVLDSY